MNHDDLREHLDGRFDRIEAKLDRHDNKLDDHLARISKAEEAIMWMKGHLKISTTFVLGLVSTAIVAYFKFLSK